RLGPKISTLLVVLALLGCSRAEAPVPPVQPAPVQPAPVQPAPAQVPEAKAEKAPDAPATPIAPSKDATTAATPAPKEPEAPPEPPPPSPQERLDAAITAIEAVPASADAAPACDLLSREAVEIPATLVTRHAVVALRCSDLRAALMPSCAALVAKTERCTPAVPGSDAPGVDDQVAACERESGARPGLLGMMGACMTRSCDDFGPCVGAAIDEMRKAPLLDRLRTAVEKKDYRGVSFACEAVMAKADSAAELRSACRDAATAALAEWGPKLEARRALGGDPELICFDYLRLASALDAPVRSAAVDICTELRIGPDLAATRAAVTTALERGRGLPASCESVSLRLLKGAQPMDGSLASTWARTELTSLATLCYVTLGRGVLSRGGDCNPDKQAVLDGISRFGVDATELGPLLEMARSRCQK
ncbi:MAG: hypothetical protein IV100_14295, partial [Myxococcales bacterium]|nr:hypothetical protein [Myxococcales bacterium]